MSLLPAIANHINIYAGIIVYIFGFSGSLLNIMILFPNRRNPYTFLSMHSPIADCFALNIGMLPRILSVGFNIDPTLSNRV
ncbi:unnamed protein product [Rotaria magnacalcarata]|uniref:G protein-coupled receptor n=1 Tax=Rotaria magnacalcarata TaxID=392030 RepID=A0A814IJS8_9BILA|nr:unnamed protein product [Rotaria magnacalcarata]CAF3844372.1 unnamed protein product [Rotaria magnacalcarata]CAF3861850.1 unnamed protein product [Rotaria magnacalcarata]CAF3891900.1 unnamed protein product [Rotaria magnacalcarata]CAF4067122.1 unnamed protein product [Rotaria magnacalcarata]